MLLTAGLRAQATAVPDTLVPIPNLIDSLAAPFPFLDKDTNGINDYYEQYAARNPLIMQQQPYLYIQYKYRNGIGYGYGFVDFNRNGINDVFDLYPHLQDMNTLGYFTRASGMDDVKQAVIRHGLVSQDKAVSGQTDANHYLHDGHCKDAGLYNEYRSTMPNRPR